MVRSVSTVAAAAGVLVLLAAPLSTLAAPAGLGVPRLCEAQQQESVAGYPQWQEEEERPMLRATRPPYKEPPVWPEQLHAGVCGCECESVCGCECESERCGYLQQGPRPSSRWISHVEINQLQ